MTDSYELTVHGLIRKRAELAGQVEALHIQLAGLMAQLHAIDTSIRVFRPAIDLEDLPDGVPPSPFTAFRGDFQRQLLEMLRASDRPNGWLRPRGRSPCGECWQRQSRHPWLRSLRQR